MCEITTRKTVAELAGVSVTVVSRVLNNSGYVSAQKREAVLEAAKKLNYLPNPIAVSLKSQRTRQLLFYIRDLSNYFNLELYRGILDAARERDYLAIVSGTLDLDRIKTLMIDGIIMPNEFFAKPEYLTALSVPVVTASFGSVPSLPVPHVKVDTGLAMEQLLDYMFQLGHQRIAFATSYKYQNHYIRSNAYNKKMLPILGKEITHYYLTEQKKYEESTAEINSFTDGEESARIFIQRQLDATAVVCFNDDTALGFISELHRHGIYVPKDLSVGGIDGHLMSRYSTPRLTTVSLSTYQQGYQCACLLIDLIQGQSIPSKIEMNIELIPGESTKPCNQ